VMMSFDDMADVSGGGQLLPSARVLKALVSVYDFVAAVLPPAGRRLVMRCARAASVQRSASV